MKTFIELLLQKKRWAFLNNGFVFTQVYEMLKAFDQYSGYVSLDILKEKVGFNKQHYLFVVICTLLAWCSVMVTSF